MKFSMRFFRSVSHVAASVKLPVADAEQSSKGAHASEATMRDKNGKQYVVRLADRRSPAERNPASRNFMPAKERCLQSHQLAAVAAWNSILPAQHDVRRLAGGDTADMTARITTARDHSPASTIALRNSAHAPISAPATNQKAAPSTPQVSVGEKCLQLAPASAITIPVARSRR